MHINRVLASVSLIAVVAACSAPSDGSSSGEDFPSKTVKIIVPFAPGGSLDSNARILADCLNGSGGKWVVENQDGGGGTIGVNNIVSAKPDGYTLGYVSSSGVALTPLQPGGARYDKDDLKPISMLTNAPAALLVRAKSPYESAEEFFDAGSKGSELSIATTGALGLYQLAVKELSSDVAVKPVPFDGAAPAVTAALGGNADAVFAEVSGSTLEQIKNGQFRALATGADKPVDFLKNVPTLASLGYDLPQSDNYGLLVADKDIPSDVSKKLASETAKCAKSEKVTKAIGDSFVLDPPLAGNDAKKVIDDATAQYQAALKDAK